MPTHLKEIAMNELFLALAEERRLKVEHAVLPERGRPIPNLPRGLSLGWLQRLARIPGHSQKWRTQT